MKEENDEEGERSRVGVGWGIEVCVERDIEGRGGACREGYSREGEGERGGRQIDR